MKLAKLSLAAIVAAGAMSFANAQPLEEAIKGVEFGGFLRYRLNDSDTNGASASANDWDFLAKFTAPVTDDIKAVMAFASVSKAGDNKGDSNGVLNVDLRKALFVYTRDALTVKAGMQGTALPVTDNGFNGNKGTGVVAMYNAGPANLIAGYYSSIGGAGANSVGKDHSASTVAVTGSFGPVNAQLWAIEVQSRVDLMIFAQADAKFDMFNVKAQVINTKLDDKIVAAGAEDTGTFYGVKVGAKFDQFSVNAGYTSNDEDQGIYSVAGGDSAEVIHPGWRVMYDIDNTADTDTFFIDAGVGMGKFGAKIGYANAEVDNANMEYDEFWGQLSYKVSKNFNTYVKYSNTEEDLTDLDRDYFRFEAKYTF